MFEHSLAQGVHAIAEDCIQVQHLSRQFMLGDAEYAPGAERTEAHADDRAGADRIDIEIALLLAGDPRLAIQHRFAHAVDVEQPLRRAEVEHQMRVAARQDACDFEGVAAFHAPGELDRIGQRRRRQQHRQSPLPERRIVLLHQQALRESGQACLPLRRGTQCQKPRINPYKVNCKVW